MEFSGYDKIVDILSSDSINFKGIVAEIAKIAPELIIAAADRLDPQKERERMLAKRVLELAGGQENKSPFEAIRFYREATGASLAEAAEYVKRVKGANIDTSAMSFGFVPQK